MTNAEKAMNALPSLWAGESSSRVAQVFATLALADAIDRQTAAIEQAVRPKKVTDGHAVKPW